MPDNKEALLGEFKAVEAKYKDLLSKLVAAKVPAVLDPGCGACDVGEWCCTGTESVTSDLAKKVNPPFRR